MNINDVFASKYIKASDLKKRPVVVIIESLTTEMIGHDSKLIMYFQGKEKGMVLNKTNANAVAYILGPETDSWTGQRIELYPTMVDYQGRPVEALRVRMPSSVRIAPPRQPAPAHNPVMQNARAPQQAQHPNAPGNGGEETDFDDQIPF